MPGGTEESHTNFRKNLLKKNNNEENCYAGQFIILSCVSDWTWGLD
jgi:hypothetical protein